MKTYLSKYLRPDQDNSKVLNGVLENAKHRTRLVFPNGVFPIHSTLQQSGKTLYWEGMEDTTLLISHSGPGMTIGPAGDVAAYIMNLTLFNRHTPPQDSEHQHGIQTEGIVISENLTIRNFFGHGLNISADISTRGSNSSFSRFTSLAISGCKGSGVYLQGGDANQSNFYHVDVRDCSGFGFWDHSFLGNQFFGCMAHNNKLGNYRADDLNSRTGFYGCYSELGSPPEYLAGHSFWIGGLPSNGIDIHGFAKAITTE